MRSEDDGNGVVVVGLYLFHLLVRKCEGREGTGDLDSSRGISGRGSRIGVKCYCSYEVQK